MRSKNRVCLKLAGIIVTFQSKFSKEKFRGEELRQHVTERFKGLLYNGRKKADILIDVYVVDELPVLKGVRELYATYHPDSNEENWRISYCQGSYVYSCSLEEKTQVVFVNKSFDRGRAYLLPKKEKGFVWDVGELIYDFLQVLLVNYLAQRKQGVLVHAVGIKDVDGRGWLFAGKSGAGKSTTAKIWHRYSRAKILNDDRVIIRRRRGKFLMCGSPWHGEFRDYLKTCNAVASLKKIFFIYHARKNKIKRMPASRVFRYLYPSIIPCFWDGKLTANIMTFCGMLAQELSCWRFGFQDNKKSISFVRGFREP